MFINEMLLQIFRDTIWQKLDFQPVEEKESMGFQNSLSFHIIVPLLGTIYRREREYGFWALLSSNAQ